MAGICPATGVALVLKLVVVCLQLQGQVGGITAGPVFVVKVVLNGKRFSCTMQLRLITDVSDNHDKKLFCFSYLEN